MLLSHRFQVPFTTNVIKASYLLARDLRIHRAKKRNINSPMPEEFQPDQNHREPQGEGKVHSPSQPKGIPEMSQ
jgi:hypothetical protein